MRVLAVFLFNRQEIIIPSGDSVVNPGDRIIIFSKRQAISKIEKFLPVKPESI